MWKLSNFVFDNIVPILNNSRKITSLRKTIGSGWKRVANGSDSKQYQTNSFAKLSKLLLENVNFGIISSMFNNQNPPSKITRYGVQLPEEDVSSYFVG